MSEKAPERIESLPIAIMPDDPGCAAKKYSTLSGQPAKKDHRRPTRKDRDKILYSQSWRRLAGITQVVSPDGEDLVLHNRLTHSEKVAQVAWSIGSNIIKQASENDIKKVEKLGGLDLDIVEAAAMAHDLGHPPFGHLGETVLDKFAIREGVIDGYEGNAQTLRILSKLARWTRHGRGRGLNLTLGTLCAAIKYPWTRGAEFFGPLEGNTGKKRLRQARRRADSECKLYWNKFGAYDSEVEVFKIARSWLPFCFANEWKYAQSLEASVMDVADDVTYAIHDLEDFVSSGLINLDDIAHDFFSGHQRLKRSFYDSVEKELSEKYPSYYSEEEMLEAEDWFHSFFESTRREVSSSRVSGEVESLLSKQTSNLLDDLALEVHISESPLWENGPLLALKRQAWHRIHLLKSFTMRYIVNSPNVAAQQRASCKLLSSVLEDMFSWVKDEKSWVSLPVALRSRLGDAAEIDPEEDHGEHVSYARAVVDYISGLTDHSVRSLYARLNPSGADQLFGLSFLN